jgi:hypothetical protein
MTPRPAREVLALPVRLHGIQLGRPLDALVDEHADRVLGFEVLCGDDARRFLPFPVARLGADEIAVDSALTLIDERDLDFYRRRSRRLSDLGLADPWLDDDGAIHEARSAA